MNFVIDWLYGGVGIASFIATWAWTNLMFARMREPDFYRIRRDTYFWICLGNALGCLGTLGLSAMRVVAMIENKEHAPVPISVLVAFVFFVALFISRLAMVYASSINHGMGRWYGTVAAIGIWTAFFIYVAG